MIGVSIVLALIKAFDWKFPDSFQVLGNTIAANPGAMEALAWIALVYFSWEYRVQLGPKLPELRTRWINRFVLAHNKKIKKLMIQKYSDSAHRRNLEEKFKDTAYSDIGEVLGVALNDGGASKLGRNIGVTVEFDAKLKGEAHPLGLGEQPYTAKYLRSGWQTTRAWVQCLLFDEVHFEHVVPVIFPIAAVLIVVLRLLF